MTGRMLSLLVRFAALFAAWALAAHVAHAQWTPSGVAGQSTAPLSDPGRALALASAARVLVVGQYDNRLSVVDPDTGSVLGYVSLPYEPRAVAINADGTRAYVVYGNSRLTAVNVSSRTIIGTWIVGGELRSLALMPGEAELAVADAGPNRLLRVNASTGAVVQSLSLAHEPREVIRGNGDAKLIVGASNGWLITVDGGSFSVLSQLKLADEIRSLTWWEAGARALVVHKRADAVSLVNIATSQVTATVQLDGDPDRAAVASGTAYIATHDDASVNRVDLAGPALLGRYAIAARVNALVFDPSANVLYGALRSDQKLVRLDPAAASLISVLQLQKRLRDVAVNPVTHEAVAVADKSDEMFVIKLADRSVRQIGLPARPDLVAVDSQLNRAIVAFRGWGSARLRFADLEAGTLFSGSLSYERDIVAMAVDSTRGLTLAITESERPVLFIDNATRARLADGPEGRYRALAVHSGRGVAYLATEDRKLKVMDLASRAITGTLDLGFKVNAIAVDEALDKAVLTTDTSDRAHVLNLATLGIESNHALPRNPGAAALQVDTHVAVVTSREADKVSLLDLNSGTVTSGFTSIERPHALGVSARYNQALVLSGERDEMAFVQLPNPVPVLEALAPSQAPSGNPALILTLTGKGFVDASKAYFGATALTTRWISATQLEADVPASLLATPATVQVTVQNPAPAGGTSNALPFTVGGTPVLSALEPSTAVADGTAKQLTLIGQNFATGAQVVFGATQLAPSAVTGTSITVTIPAAQTNVPGVTPVSVLNPGGQVSNSLPFTLTPALQITAIAPTSGDVGTLVTLTGNGFDPSPAANTLVFRGINNTVVGAAALTATATQITVRVPPLAETGPITLSNSRGIVQSPPFTVTREQDFQLVVNPAAATVYQGASNSFQAQLSSTGTRTFTGLVTLSVQGLPAGVTASFAPAATLSAFQAGTVTLTATGSAAPASYPVTVQATFTEGGAIFVRSASVNLAVANSAGVTGVKGRFVTPEGQAIAGVIVRADVALTPQPQTVTDAAGNFQLVGLPAGSITFRFDATPAHPLYPIWPYTTNVVANQITVISDWTINPPPSDDKFVPIANATQNQSITDERFPGLEIKLPQGVTITGWDGVLKTRIAVEKIMPDKLPVAAPPVPIREAYQLYFGTPMGGIPSQPIPVTLPNVSEKEPGEQVEIWFFDGSPMGGSGEWKMAGLGTVSPDGKTVASNPGVGIPRFCGVCGLLSLSCPPPPNPPQPPPDDCPVCGKPVDLFTGQELMTMAVLGLDGRTPIDLALKYNPVDAYNNRAGTVTSFGFGWTASYDIGFLPFEGPQKRLVLPGGKFVNFIDDGSGSYKSFDDPSYDGAVITRTNAAANEWQLRLKTGMIWRFKPFAGIPGVIRGGPPTFLTEIVDQMGSSLQISRQSNGRITAIGTAERNLRMTYGTNGFVSEVTDTANRTLRFAYTASNRLQTMTDADGKVSRYTYVDDSEIAVDPACAPQETTGERIKTVLFPGRTRVTENFYGASRRVLRQVGHDGREFRITYKVTGACVTHASSPGVKCTANCPDADSWENFQAGWRIHGGRVVGTTVKNPNGTTISHSFGAKGTVPSFNNAEGQPTRIKYDKSNRPVEVTDALGRTQKLQYDDSGNVVRSTDALGRNTDFVYDERWGKHTSVTRYLSDGTPVVMQDAYDSAGRRIRMTDPLGNVTTYSYTPRGELASITAPGNRVSTLAYNAAGDLVRLTNPLGNEVAFETDGAGRMITITDPLGFNTRVESNGRDEVTKFINPLQGETRYVFDDGYRLTSVIDPRNNAVESYQYDDQDRLAAKVDAFNKAHRYEYDSAGRPLRSIDRKGQVAEFTFDAKDRITRVNYAGVVQTLTYDAAGRLAEIREPDSAVGYVYDLADRLITMRTDSAAGRTEIGYEYDTLNRVVRRTLNGGDPTDYTYDKAGRVLSILYRGRTTEYTWDELGRLTSKKLPDGIRQNVEYDDASQITRIEYVRFDGTPIETIAYRYDARGQRISKSTSSPSVQETPIVAVYDAGNRLTGLTLSGRNYLLAYDDNGNLRTRTDQANPGDVTTYSWDTRDRLVGIAGPGVSATFAYDVLGRRMAKTVNGINTDYLYDGKQAIAEISGAANKAILSGLAIDEAIARYTDAGERSYLTDALGSVIAQAKTDQSIQNLYSYTPYGEVGVLGDDEGNSIQYTGRENDLTGLYYYRARYYDPVLKRFITEDPIGLGGGVNVYAYVSGAPTLATDASGLCTYLGTFFIRNEVEYWIIKGRGYIRSETWLVPDWANWSCDPFPPSRMDKYVPLCLPKIKWKTYDLYELGERQYARTYELWEAYYMCNPTCDIIADQRIPEKRNKSDWKKIFDDLRMEWIPR